jgi:hypothetical protein
MQMPECEHLNPRLFEVSKPPTTQFTGPEKAVALRIIWPNFLLDIWRNACFQLPNPKGGPGRCKKLPKR